MATDDAVEEILELANDYWDRWGDALREALTVQAKAWEALIVAAQRAHLCALLVRLHVSPRVAMLLAEICPQRLLPRFDPAKWPANDGGD